MASLLFRVTQRARYEKQDCREIRSEAAHKIDRVPVIQIGKLAMCRYYKKVLRFTPSNIHPKNPSTNQRKTFLQGVPEKKNPKLQIIQVSL